MAHHKDAKKRLKQNEKRRLRNKAVRSVFRKNIKECRQAIESKDQTLAKEKFKEAEKSIRKAVSKGVIHANTGNRYISRMAQKINSLSPQNGSSGPA